MSSIVIEDRVSIPGSTMDLEAFRNWARSEEFPERGQFAFLDGEVWVDLSMEEFFTHNQVKAAIAYTILSLLQRLRSGRFVPDRMLLTHAAANLSVEPDGLFFLWETMKSGRLSLIEAVGEGYVELQGTPDMVLEIVSRYSVRKDTLVLRDLYHRAEVPEYWLVDARGETASFQILKYQADGYVEVAAVAGWVRSEVFGCDFQLKRDVDPLGHPQFTLATR